MSQRFSPDVRERAVCMVVERTIAWLNRCRRLSKDWERLNQNALAFLRWASSPDDAQKTL